MKPVSEKVRQLSIASLESTCRKLRNSYESAVNKNASTTLIEKRLNAVQMGLNSLQNMWEGKPMDADREKVIMSTTIIRGLLPSIERQLAKANNGSPQHTLNERRLVALQLAIESLEQRLI